MRWGLVPRWAKDLKVGYRMINAKTENLTKSKAYGPLVGKFRHRCLIVADGFYEWMKAEDPKQPRQPWRFTVDGGEPFAFAGICTRKEWEDDWLYSCTIITTTPNEVVKPVHDRMPVILPSAEAEQAWLGTDLSAEDAVSMCVPLDPGRMQSAPANPKLNKVGKGIEGPGATRRGGCHGVGQASFRRNQRWTRRRSLTATESPGECRSGASSEHPRASATHRSRASCSRRSGERTGRAATLGRKNTSNSR